MSSFIRLIVSFKKSQNNHIHATARPEIWEQHNNIIFEGGLYQIINIRVREAVDPYKPVQNSRMISLLPSTVINLYEDDNLMIPFHKFELTPLVDLSNLVFPHLSHTMISSSP